MTPAEAAAIAFWLGLPWSMKMVAGVASDVYPILGSRRGAYLLLGALCALAGYAALATTAATRGAYLACSVLIAVGFMVQDVVADALSVEIAESDEEIGQIQTLGRMALLAGASASATSRASSRARIGSAGDVRGGHRPAADRRGHRALHPASPRARRCRRRTAGGGGAARRAARRAWCSLVGLGYAALGAALEPLGVPFSREIVLVVSAALIVLLLHRVGDLARRRRRRHRHLPVPRHARRSVRATATGRSIASASTRSSSGCSRRSPRC